jgi:ElaB/YqjD/DUF883 family membrane-anchored ribosome-binding protein
MNKATIETLQQRLEELTEAGRNYLENDELQQQILNLKSESEALIRKHPLASIVAGLAVGYLIGRLLSRD